MDLSCATFFDVLLQVSHFALWFPTIEVDRADVVQQQAALDRVHAAADAVAAGTEVLVHAVQGVGHRVHGIDHELDLPLLLVARVPADPLLPCGRGTTCD